MTKTTRQGFFQPKTLALAVALGTAAPAYAVSFNIGEIEGQFDSSMSVGASWAMDSPDMDLVGSANGGTGYTQTGDDGRLNFKKGETFSKIFKGVHDLELRYRDSGAFVRGKYWYDFELKDESRLHKDISDSNRKEAAQSSGAEILDAFLYHNYYVGDLPGTVRIGRQVVSWGESTFIGNSINSINPLDAAAFRRPGAEIKEGLIPVNMLYVSQSLSDRLSMEAFYQLEWDQTIIDNCGTFFSGADVAADGCDTNYHVGPAALAGALNSPLGAYASANGVTYTSEGVMIPRGGDRDARDSGQFGLALRWLGDATEYGFYFMNYHSRTPILSSQTAGLATFGTSQTVGGAAGTAAGNAAYAQAIAAGATPTQAAAIAAQVGAQAGEAIGGAILLGNGQYFLEYPEDIRLYGMSFSTTLPTGTAWSGEISYRPNAPIQINTTDVTLELTDPTRAGFENRGYNRKEITQLQTTFTHFFDQILGAGRVTVVGEIGYAHVGGLESTSELRYGRDANFGTPTDALALAANGRHGFVTANSWGYRLRALADYSNVFAGVNLTPNVSFSHDVDGYGPNGLFNEGSKAVSIGVDAVYQNTYTASLSYTDFFGGDFNMLTDRDFLAFSVGVNF
ncbi:type V secretory pathway, adhesin AidA [Stutzerimonas stutzeri]|nr:type V secretory pathway, adhesin AidA [Stutzerimonas stutzeri]